MSQPDGVRESMIAPLRKIRACRAIPVVLGIAWLPYITTRCENPLTHTGCGILPAAVYEEGHEPRRQRHGDSDDGMAQGHHHQHKHLPVRTCCELTGKCDIKITSGTPSLVPLMLVADLPAAVHPILARRQLRHRRSAPAVAHAPPTYLRKVALLI
jgi:hypothetical protein